MADTTARAVITIDATTAAAVKEINKLADAQKAAAKATEEHGGAISKFVKSGAEGFATFNLALGGVEKAFGLLKGAMDVAFEVSKKEAMEKMLPTDAVDKLSEASSHLVSRQETLRLSVRGMTGDFKITEDQMGKVLAAAAAMSQKGLGPAAEMADVLLDAVAGKTKHLKTLGIAFTETGSAAGNLNELMEKMNGLISDPANAIDERTKGLANMRDEMELVTETIHSLEAALVELFAETIKGWQDILGFTKLHAAERERDAAIDRGTRLITAPTPSGNGYDPYADMLNVSRVVGPGRANYLSDSDYAANIYGEFGGTPGVEKKWTHVNDTNKDIPKVYVVNQEDAGEHIVDALPVTALKAIGDMSLRMLRLADNNHTAGNGELNFFDQSRLGSRYNSAFARPTGLNQIRSGGTSFGRGSSEGSDLAGIGNGGWANDTEGTLKADAFAGLSSGINAAVQAAVDGSDSIGRSAAKASAAVLKSIAIEATGRAIFEGALALGSLAIGDIPGATKHGLAAAQYAIAAGSVGALAATLGSIVGGGGGGASSGASAPAGGGFGSATGGTASTGPQNITINVGEGFSGDPKKLGEVVGRAIRTAQLSGQRSTYATTVSG